MTKAEARKLAEQAMWDFTKPIKVGMMKRARVSGGMRTGGLRRKPVNDQVPFIQKIG